MDSGAAQKVLDKWVAKLRTEPYRELAARVGTATTDEIPRDAERFWQVEVQVSWDDEPDGNVRVTVSVDDGGLRAFVPMTSDFIKSPSGEFIGE
jgi:hypothetical protein